MADNAYKPYNIKAGENALKNVSKWLSGANAEFAPVIGRIVADDISGETKIFLMKKYGSASDLTRSIGGEGKGLKAEVFTDNAIFPGGGLREFGGSYGAFRSKFVDKKTGTRLLFIPLKKDARPADWKFLTMGLDFILAPKVHHDPGHFILDSINSRINGHGSSPTLNKKIGDFLGIGLELPPGKANA